MNDARTLNEREQLILHAVVHTYITTAEAVGSRTIVKRLNLDLSPATVRNVMADLEEAGYLEQLHTSSGRVPTDRGYRYYVDYLMRVQELSLTERARIEEELARSLSDVDEVMRQTSHLLALVSHQTGIVNVPQDAAAQVRRVDLVAVSPSRVAVMVVDNLGRVRTQLAAMNEPVGADELNTLSRFLNEGLAGAPVENLALSLRQHTQHVIDERRRLADRALSLLATLPPSTPATMFLEGATQLFEQPEFQNMQRAREVLTLLDERERLNHVLRDLLRQDSQERTAVLIGSESREAGLEEISVVASPYHVGQRRVGMIGVLGPRRMPYSKLTALVEYTAGALSRFLTRLAS